MITKAELLSQKLGEGVHEFDEDQLALLLGNKPGCVLSDVDFSALYSELRRLNIHIDFRAEGRGIVYTVFRINAPRNLHGNEKAREDIFMTAELLEAIADAIRNDPCCLDLASSLSEDRFLAYIQLVLTTKGQGKDPVVVRDWLAGSGAEVLNKLR